MTAPAPEPAVLAIDMGTSSLRTALFDIRGERLPDTMARHTYSLVEDKQGRAELNPTELLDAAQACLAETISQLGNCSSHAGQPATICTVGISCFWHSLLAVDETGQPISPIFTWADSRCIEHARALRAELNETAIHAQTGCLLRESFWPAKLRWLAQTQPELYQEAARWLSPGEWLVEALCGSDGAAVSHSMASGTGLYATGDRSWDDNMLAVVGLDRTRVNPISDEPARLSPRWRDDYPALAEAAWYPAIGDGAASNLGSGCNGAKRIAINVGTSAAVRCLFDDSPTTFTPPPTGLFQYRLDEKRSVVGGATSNGGNLRAWCQRHLRLPADDAALETTLADRPEPVVGLTVLPFWMPDRAPTWNDSLPAAVVGLTGATSALDIVQAATDASYHRLALILEQLESTHPATQIIVSGGITNSPQALHRLANILDRSICISPEPQASARGAARWVLEREGIQQPSPAQRFLRVVPDPALVPLFARQREKQVKLEEGLAGWGR